MSKPFWHGLAVRFKNISQRKHAAWYDTSNDKKFVGVLGDHWLTDDSIVPDLDHPSTVSWLLEQMNYPSYQVMDAYLAVGHPDNKTSLKHGKRLALSIGLINWYLGMEQTRGWFKQVKP